MERVEAEKEFMEKCYMPLFQSWLQEVTQQYGAEFNKNETLFVMYIKQFLDAVSKVQDRTGIELGVITCSILWTSLLDGTPAILMEAYAQKPFVDDPIMGEKVSVPWMFYHWSNFVESMERRCGELGLGTYIRLPEVKAKAIQAARDIVFIYWIAMKAHLRQFPETTTWRNLKKGPLLCVTLGEYMECQYALLGEREELDLTLLEPNSSARFARFQNKVYRNQRFEGFVLSDTVFERCTFQNVEFEACTMCDARFIDCTFEHCTFSNLSLMGTEIYATRLTDAIFERVWSETGQSGERKDFLSCGHTSITNCLLERVSFRNTELRQARVDNCQFIKLHVLESDLCASLQKHTVEEE